jgi:hypothetical protein
MGFTCTDTLPFMQARNVAGLIQTEPVFATQSCSDPNPHQMVVMIAPSLSKPGYFVPGKGD